jgi:hypothetical protein
MVPRYFEWEGWWQEKNSFAAFPLKTARNLFPLAASFSAKRFHAWAWIVETARSDLFAAIVRATCWVFVQIRPDKSAAGARAFLEALHEACPIRIAKILTDNGKEFTDRLFASREREPSGQHEFDQLC